MSQVVDRRKFLASTSAVAVTVAMAPAKLFAQVADGAADASANTLYERIFAEAVATSPELASSLGLDRGPNAGLKGQLSPRTVERRQAELARTNAARAALAAIDRSTLSSAGQLNLDVVRYQLDTQVAAQTRFGMDGVMRPYRIFQQGGAYFSVPDFLNTAHTVRSSEDAEAYLSRLEQFGSVLDQESVRQREEATRGLLAPAWSLDLTLGQMRALRGQAAADSSMTRSLANRAAAANIPGDWAARATRSAMSA